MKKFILDATCGSRMIWFQKNYPGAVYADEREEEDSLIWKSGDGKSERHLSVRPDVICDFTDLPFADETFYLVVFDPPHLLKIGEKAWLCRKYGKLHEGWQEEIHKGFLECMRVLKPCGTLIFKWSETDIPTRDVIRAIGQEPLFGHRSGKRAGTHWMCFAKEPTEDGE